jgi:saxitoxin biosynthesis operon SxtJ-like protein
MEGDDRLAQSVPARLSSTYTAAAGRKFGLTVGLAFLALSAIAWWRGHPTTLTVLASLGGVLVLAGLVVPALLGPVDRGWMKLALLISKVTTPIIMGVIYYVVLTPVAFMRRLIGGSALVHRDGAHGVWFDRTSTPRSSLERLF